MDMKDEMLDIIKDSIIGFLICVRESQINLNEKDAEEIEILVNAFIVATFKFSMKTPQDKKDEDHEG